MNNLQKIRIEKGLSQGVAIKAKVNVVMLSLENTGYVEYSGITSFMKNQIL